MRCDAWAFEEDGENDDEHSDESESGRAGEFVDVSVEGERVGDAYCAEGDDELTVSEDAEDWCGGEGGEDVSDDVGYRIAYQYTMSVM